MNGQGRGVTRAIVLAAMIAASLIVPASASALQADTYADASVATDTAPCTQATPCRQISTALLDTAAGGTVHVADGNYTETLSVDGGKSLVYDGSGPPFGAVITSPSVATAISVGAGQSAGVISGFTLRASNTAVQLSGAGTISGNRFDTTTLNSFGIVTQGSDAKTITQNELTGSGTLAQTGVFVTGVANVTGNTIVGMGTGINVSEGSPTITGNDVGASAFNGGVGILVQGGTFGAAPTITGNHVHGVDLGTGVRILQGGTVPTVGATLSRNRLISNGVGLSLDNSAGPVTLQSDLLVSNGTAIIANDLAGGTENSNLSATNITIWGGSFGAHLFDTALVLDSSIFGEAGITPEGTASCAITNSRGPAIAAGCSAFQTTASPQFVDQSNPDPALNNYHLAAGSPMIDHGNPLAPAVGARDIDGNARAIAGVCGGAVRRDIGADEFKPTCAPPPSSGGGGTTVQPVAPSVVDPCPPLRKKLKKAKKAHNKPKVRKLKRKLRALGCI
jgi:hypothetical protein